jgi:hypothetical protein
VCHLKENKIKKLMTEKPTERQMLAQHRRKSRPKAGPISINFSLFVFPRKHPGMTLALVVGCVRVWAAKGILN